MKLTFLITSNLWGESEKVVSLNKEADRTMLYSLVDLSVDKSIAINNVITNI